MKEINWDTFTEDMVKKIDNEEILTEKELSYFVEDTIVDIEGDEHRWSRDVKSIVRSNEKLFAVDWDRGLTESQENMYYNQPYEVQKVTKKVVKEITEYVRMK